MKCISLPGNEEDFAFLAIFIGGEVEVKNSIAAFISRERVCEIFIGFIRTTDLIYHHLLFFDFVGDVSESSLCF